MARDMPTHAATPADREIRIGTAAAFAALASLNLGATFAKQLFPLVGAYGVTALRIVLGAAVLCAITRPWRRPPDRALVPALVGYGAVLGVMNLIFYQAIARIPIGIAIGIEVLGPLTVAVLGSRTMRDFAWLGAAVIGLLFLLPLRASDPLDPAGVGFALGAALCWGLYIVSGKRVSGAMGRDAVSWGLIVASVIVLPVGMTASGARLVQPWALVIGLAIAILSSAIPYTLEMEAMRRVPRHVFGMLMSASPAIGAAVGYLVLGETLTGVQAFALSCIICAAAGSALTTPRVRRAAASAP